MFIRILRIWWEHWSLGLNTQQSVMTLPIQRHTKPQNHQRTSSWNPCIKRDSWGQERVQLPLLGPGHSASCQAPTQGHHALTWNFILDGVGAVIISSAASKLQNSIRKPSSQLNLQSSILGLGVGAFRGPLQGKSFHYSTKTLHFFSWIQ